MEENENLELSQVQYEDDTYEPGTVETGEQYSGIKDTTVLLNPTTGETIDLDTLSPFERIKYVSLREGKTINDPDPKCKHCYGRGYVNIDAVDNIPTPCKCLFRDFYKQNPHFNVSMPSYNRKARRAMERASKKKPVSNPALEKRQKRMNDLMINKIRQMLATETSENAQNEQITESEVVSEIMTSVEQETKETVE